MLLLVLGACDPQTSSKDSPTDTGDSGTTLPTDSDTSDTEDTGGTTGPGLPDCTPQTGSGSLVALSGVLLTPDGPVGGSLVYDSADATITCVGDCDVSAATVVCTEGIISAGLVDPHNHLQYNSLPVWDVPPEFDDRYDWQGDDRYDDFKNAFNDIKDAYVCEIMQWAEAREVMHGTTSAVGSSGGDCIDGIIRNLDEGDDASGFDGYNLDYSASDVTDAFDESDAADWTNDLASGSIDAVLNHVAEGREGNVTDEIDYMFDIGAVGPGQVFVHATDATTEQLAYLAATGTGIIWSPRSNLALYATTTPVEIADALGVPWAIGTDWTPSGSMAPTLELACADEWLTSKGSPISDATLYAKSTTDAARLVGLDGVIGQLAVGAAADIAVFDYSADPYDAVIHAGPAETRLTIVAGVPVYGKKDLMSALTSASCSEMDVCGDQRWLCLPDTSIEDVEATLTAAMAGIEMASGYEYAAELFPLFECTDSRESCDLSAPTASDADGDGVDDGDDLCPDAYDPNQWDSDGDGLGDTCDVCPMVVGEDCTTGGADIDGDGIENEEDNCPYAANEDQADADGDATGDVCDACPEEPNPGGEGCTTSIDAIRDGTFPDGSAVKLSGLVVTAVAEGIGFTIQNDDAGVMVYDLGSNVVAIGDVVTVNGIVSDYYGWLELTDATATVTGTDTVPAAKVLDACTAVTEIEAYESMLVRVDAVSVTDLNPDAPDDYDEFTVDGCLRVDDYFYKDLDQPTEMVDYASVTGVLIYTYDNVKLAPRSSDDLVE